MPRVMAYAVHLLTASGVVVSSLIVAAIWAGDYRTAFVWMIVAVLIDAGDGPLARAVNIRAACPEIDGRKLDDLVDYLNYTFLPIMLLWHARWLPQPYWLWATLPLLTSLFGFAHTGAKLERRGFFRGFPSYWNIVALYIAVWVRQFGPWTVAAIVLVLSILTVSPLQMVYPNRAPRWRALFIVGGLCWAVTLFVLLAQFPKPNIAWIVLSLIYPCFYVGASVYLALCPDITAEDAE